MENTVQKTTATSHLEMAGWKSTHIYVWSTLHVMPDKDYRSLFKGKKIFSSSHIVGLHISSDLRSMVIQNVCLWLESNGTLGKRRNSTHPRDFACTQRLLWTGPLTIWGSQTALYGWWPSSKEALCTGKAPQVSSFVSLALCLNQSSPKHPKMSTALLPFLFLWSPIPFSPCSK